MGAVLLRRAAMPPVERVLESIFGKPVILKKKVSSKGFLSAEFVVRGGRVEVFCTITNCYMYLYKGLLRYRCTENGCTPLGRMDGLLGETERVLVELLQKLKENVA